MSMYIAEISTEGMDLNGRFDRLGLIVKDLRQIGTGILGSHPEVVDGHFLGRQWPDIKSAELSGVKRALSFRVGSQTLQLWTQTSEMAVDPETGSFAHRPIISQGLLSRELPPGIVVELGRLQRIGDRAGKVHSVLPIEGVDGALPPDNCCMLLAQLAVSLAQGGELAAA